MGRWGSVVCAVGRTAADVASLNHLHTSASEPDLILDGRLTLSFPPLQLPFKDEVLGSQYKLVVFAMAMRPHSLAQDLATLLGGVLESFSKLSTFMFSE